MSDLQIRSNGRGPATTLVVPKVPLQLPQTDTAGSSEAEHRRSHYPAAWADSGAFGCAGHAGYVDWGDARCFCRKCRRTFCRECSAAHTCDGTADVELSLSIDARWKEVK